MISRVLSAYASEVQSERYVNYHELYHSEFLRIHDYALKNGCAWEHEDVVAVTERYCEEHAKRLMQRTTNYSESIPLIAGPKEFLLDRVHAELRVGDEYEIELVLLDSIKKPRGVVGRIDLKSYVTVVDSHKGQSVLDFENDEHLLLKWMSISRSQDLNLRIRGAIRVLSSIDCIIQVQDEQ
ncbi:hypothetical protein [Lacimicrobium alkaliphilum]|uniref:Uncharacterized protein n=1 Tax=Lacimicrobium alkaliphilum TaxID=1526571 RepID=A0ABQ1RBP9_9ALTE|nr:hypothetical protein [Lacimicrobium alkaliphilum]GGD61652.1 hypothetical protein GCM10011357_16210 [Lacimicrobium alkaliphilum]